MLYQPPSYHDYRVLEYELAEIDDAYAKMPIVYRWRHNARFVGESLDDLPERILHCINTTADDKEQLFVSYCTFHEPFLTNLCKRLPERLRAVGYRGHLLIQKGGWPDQNLALAKMPYTFKPAMLNEGRRLGYKRVFWIDASLDPQKDPQYLFDHLQKSGLFYTYQRYFVSKALYPVLDMEKHEAYPNILGSLLGFDFTNERACQLLDDFYAAAEEGTPFATFQPDQTIFALLAPRAGFTPYCYFLDVIARRGHPPHRVKNCTFLMDDVRPAYSHVARTPPAQTTQ